MVDAQIDLQLTHEVDCDWLFRDFFRNMGLPGAGKGGRFFCFTIQDLLCYSPSANVHSDRHVYTSIIRMWGFLPVV